MTVPEHKTQRTFGVMAGTAAAGTALAQEPVVDVPKLQRLAELIIKALAECTGHKELQRKTIAYYILVTHSLPYMDRIAILCILGKMGTGKSVTERIAANFARKALQISLRGMTIAAVRERLQESCEGTAIVEEADASFRDEGNVERLISDRYERTSAQAAMRVPINEKAWATVTKKYFGATILHRRLPFADAALDGRSITVQTRPDNSRPYRPFALDDQWNAEGRELVKEMAQGFKLPEVEPVDKIASRIFNTWAPLISVARLLGDDKFEGQIINKLATETHELREAQQSEPDGLVLSAILYHVMHGDDGDELLTPSFSNIKLSKVNKHIFEEHRISLQARQIGAMARNMGFVTKKSNGIAVISPTLGTLVRACDDMESEDEAVERLRKMIP